jgi:hypothetical protein
MLLVEFNVCEGPAPSAPTSLDRQVLLELRSRASARDDLRLPAALLHQEDARAEARGDIAAAARLHLRA